MIPVARAVVTVFVLSAVASATAQVPQSPSPAAPASATQGSPPPAAPPIVSRTFTAPAGLLFNTVRPERVKDFETFLGHLQAALEKATDPNIKAQARGWRTFKASEPGPNNTVMYVFVLDPTVKGADYSLGRILADAYPDTARLTEIWKLYTTSVVGGGSLLGLTPVMPPVKAP